MTILNAAELSYYDVSQREHNGKSLAIVEALYKVNDVIDDIVTVQGNNGTGHKSAVRTYQTGGVKSTVNGVYTTIKSNVANVNEPSEVYKGAIKIGEDIYKLAKDKNALKLSESRPAMHSTLNDFVTDIFYGSNASDPDSITGFANRINAASNAQFIDAGGTGSDNTSIYLVGWNEATVHCFYPVGTNFGLDLVDEGMQVFQDSNGNIEKKYVSTFSMWGGLAVPDIRYVVRIGNIDVSDLLTVGDTSDSSANLIKYMDFATETIQDRNIGRLAFYVNRTAKKCLKVMMKTHPRVNLTLDNLYGRTNVLTYDGVPIRTVDALLNTEARVV